MTFILSLAFILIVHASITSKQTHTYFNLNIITIIINKFQKRITLWTDGLKKLEHGQKVRRCKEIQKGGTGKKDKAWADLDIKSEGLKQPGWWDKGSFKRDLLKEGSFPLVY